MEGAQADVRGAVLLVISGEQYKLDPCFRNLAAAERALGRSCIDFLVRARGGDISISDVAKIIHATALPAEGSKYPKGWGLNYVGQAMCDEGVDTYIAAAVEMLGSAMSAKPKKQTAAEGDNSGEA